MIIASLYSKPVNKSIAFHYGQKNNGYSAFIPNTRYLVYQPRLTDAIIVIFGLLSYEHPCNKMVFFVALLMPYASHLCTFVWIVYHADGKRQHSFTPFAGRIEPDDGL